jgi:septum formation protein
MMVFAQCCLIETHLLIRSSMPNNQMAPNLILASQSPRRKDLLEQAGLAFEVIPGNFDEDSVPLDAPESYARLLALEKANQIGNQYPDSWVIGADTVVWINGAILGKPHSKQDACSMLNQLSGQTHQVVTGYALIRNAEQKLFTDAVRTDVSFKTLSTEEIEWYIHTSEPFDKAGGYAIQGLGTFLVKGIKGSYTNVVGLPVCEVIELLYREGVIRPGPGERWSLL